MVIRAFELLFDPPQPKSLLSNARAHIALSSYSMEGERIVLSGECLTVAEVEEFVKGLKEDLDRILAEARRKFPQRYGGAGN